MTSETIAAAVGQEFTIQLQSTPTTGYVWEVEKLPQNVRLSKSEYEKPEDTRPGAPVTQLFRFQAQKAGKHKITFVLKRSWEESAIESHTVTVKAS